MMSRNNGLSFKKIAGCLVLVFALHYVLDEPTRSSLIRTVFRQRQRTPPHAPDQDHHLPVSQHDQGLLRDASFERWDALYLQDWFSVVTIGAPAVVKQEMEYVRHGRSAVRLESTGSGHGGNVYQALPQALIPRLRGHRLTFSAWALSMVPGAPCLQIMIDDEESSRSNSACLQGPRAWQPVTVERVIGPDATRIVLAIHLPREVMGETPTSVYVDSVSLAEDPPLSEAPGTIAVTAPFPSPSSERR